MNNLSSILKESNNEGGGGGTLSILDMIIKSNQTKNWQCTINIFVVYYKYLSILFY